jgi:5-methylcytosine-specific restriction endonuclease McrA
LVKPIAHHKKPWADGGKTTLRNSELLCSECHSKKPKPKRKEKQKENKPFGDKLGLY